MVALLSGSGQEVVERLSCNLMQPKELAIAGFDTAVDTIFQIFGATSEAEDTLNAELQVRKCLQELLFQQELGLRDKGRQELAQQQESFQRQRHIWQRRQAELQRHATEALEVQRKHLAAREQELAEQLRTNAEDEQRLAEDRARFAEEEASANESRRRQQEEHRQEAKRLAALEVQLNGRKAQPVPAKPAEAAIANPEKAISNPDDNGSIANESASAMDAFRQQLADFEKDVSPGFPEDVNPGFPKVEDEIQTQSTKPMRALLNVPNAEASRLSNPNSPSKQTASEGPRKWKTCRKQIRSNTGGHAPDLFDQMDRSLDGNAASAEFNASIGLWIGGGGVSTSKSPEFFEQLDFKREGILTHKVGQQPRALECAHTSGIGEPTSPKAITSANQALVLPSPNRPALAALARFAAPIAQALGLSADSRGSDGCEGPVDCQRVLV